MKKLIIILLTISLLVLGACGQQQTSEDTEAVDDYFVIGEFREIDLIFDYNNVSYPLNSEAAPLLEALGSEYTETTAPSCVYDGEDKMFEYDNMTIYTYPTDGIDMIDEIYFFGGDFQTTKDIKIGSTLEEVKEQYGQGFDKGSTYEYVLSGDKDDVKSPRLTFEISDGKVTGISFYSASNVAE